MSKKGRNNEKDENSNDVFQTLQKAKAGGFKQTAGYDFYRYLGFSLTISLSNHSFKVFWNETSCFSDLKHTPGVVSYKPAVLLGVFSREAPPTGLAPLGSWRGASGM